MPDVPNATLAALSGEPAGVRVLQASFVSASATTGCLVDINGSRIPAFLGTSFMPEINELVWLWNIGDWFFIMGPTAPKPDQGVVVSVAGSLVTLTSSLGTTVVAPYTGTAPVAGQSVKLLWHGGPFAMLMSTSPAPAAPPPAPASTVTQHVQEFPAVDSGSYGSRWFTGDVWGSDSNLGAWFYGSKISDTIPSSATIQRLEFYVSPKQISGSAPNFATHPHYSKPVGVPSLTTIGAVGIVPGWIDLGSVGLSIGSALKSGGGAAGVGLNHGGFNILSSLSDDGFSGRLRITSTY